MNWNGRPAFMTPAANGSSSGMPRRLKVLHVIPTIGRENGGPVRALIGFVNCLKGKAQIEIATTRSRLDPKELKSFKQSVGNIPVHCFSQFGRHSWNISFPLSAWLSRNVASYDLLHIHVLFSPMTTVAAFWARRRGVPYIIKPMGTLSFYTFLSTHPVLKRIYFSLFDRHTVEGARAIHFTSALEAKKIYPKCRLPYEKAVIPNPIPFLEKNGKKHGTSRDPVKILFMSRIDPKKGLPLLIGALSQMADGRQKAPELMIAGSGERHFVSKVRREIQGAGLGRQIKFLGFIEGEEKERVLGEADLLVLPSYDENFGIAVAEAMAMGVPVVVSDRVGIGRDIKEYGAGVVVKCSVNSLRRGLEKVIDNPKLRDEMGRAGRRLVREKYSPEKVGEALFNLYRKISR